MKAALGALVVIPVLWLIRSAVRDGGFLWLRPRMVST